MRRIIQFFVRRRAFVDFLTLSVILLGLGSLLTIRREAFPNISFDVITIKTVYPGATPKEVETLITNPLEQDLQEVDGIDRLLSTSGEGLSVITVYLDPDQTTSDEAETDIQTVVDRFSELPENAEDPLVVALETKLSPIIEVSVGGDIPELELRKTARRLEREIESLDGVARVAFRGLRDVEIQVAADQRKLARYQLSLSDLIDALARANVSIPAGSLTPPVGSGRQERLVRTVGTFRGLNDVETTVVRANEYGRPILVKDVAEIKYSLEDPETLNFTRGLPAISLTVLKKENSDAITVVDEVVERVNALRPSMPQGVRLEFINDVSEFIRRRLGVLAGNFVIGLGLVLLALPFIIPMRFTIVIAAGIPFAFLGAMMVLFLTGKSINLVSMIGLIIVVGILVDDSIVVSENAARLAEKGAPPEQAAIDGAGQIAKPVAASLLTTIAAFVPLALMSGIFGKFVVEVPIAVISALIVSYLETVLILPGHIAHWSRLGRKRNKMGKLGRAPAKTRNAWEKRVVPAYIGALKFALRHRYAVLAGFVLFFAGSVILATQKMRVVLFPPEGVETFFIRTEAPVGTSLAQHAQWLEPIVARVERLPRDELKQFTTSIGIQQQDESDPQTRRGSQFGQIAVYLTPDASRDRSAAEIITDLRKRISHPPGITRVTFDRVNPGPPVGKPVSLGVRGTEYAEILPAVEKIKAYLAKVDGVTDISDDYALGKEELQVRLNPSEAAAAGLDEQIVGRTVRSAIDGWVATKVSELDEEIDVRVTLGERERERADILSRVEVLNPGGSLIPLSAVSRIERVQEVASYEHEDNQRQVRVTAEVDHKRISATQANDLLRKKIPELKKEYPLLSFDFGGEEEDTQESLDSLARAFVYAVVGIFLILLLTFNQFIQPLLIVLTIPLGLISVIWAFFLHGLPISFLGMVGVIALAGVLANNTIVFVDFVNQRREQGANKLASIIEAARVRARPIFLTAFTTSIGLFPTAYGIGGHDKFVVPIALALAWGILFGSLLTAFVFPAALAVSDDLVDKMDKRREKRLQAA